MFSDEFAVSGRLFNGTGFSLFADVTDLDFAGEPTETSSVEGAIRVIQVKEAGDAVIVRLPRPTLENGQIIPVKKESVFRKRAHQDA